VIAKSHLAAVRIGVWGLIGEGSVPGASVQGAPTAAEARAWAPVLHIGSTAGAPWRDVWDASNIRRPAAVIDCGRATGLRLMPCC
jgi:hypothetical protein